MRGAFQRGTLPLRLLLAASESCASRKETRPPQLMSASPLLGSVLRSPTASNRKPYSSPEPQPTDELPRQLNSALDRKREVPQGSCRVQSQCCLSHVPPGWGENFQKVKKMTKALFKFLLVFCPLVMTVSLRAAVDICISS